MSAGTASQIVCVEPTRRSRTFVWLKRGLQTLFVLCILPRLVCYRLARLLLGARAFGASSESIARIPGLRGVYARQAFYRATLRSCGHDVYFGWNSVFSMTEAEVGERVYIGRFCSLGFAVLEDEVMLADRVQILSGGREHGAAESADSTRHSAAQRYEQVRIGRGAWIGVGAIIMADVGAGAVIGAGAVVNKPIPAGCVAVGVPAKIVKQPQPATPAHLPQQADERTTN